MLAVAAMGPWSMLTAEESAHPIDYKSADSWKTNGPATQILQRSKFAKSNGTPGKDNSILLCNADLFPDDGMFSRLPASSSELPGSQHFGQLGAFDVALNSQHSVQISIGDEENTIPLHMLHVRHCSQ